MNNPRVLELLATIERYYTLETLPKKETYEDILLRHYDLQLAEKAEEEGDPFMSDILKGIELINKYPEGSIEHKVPTKKEGRNFLKKLKKQVNHK